MRRSTAFLSRWGFACLVGVATATALAGAGLSPPPAEVPEFALRAAVIYRLEIGVAVFLALYLASLAFVLALHNRGFSEIGTAGVKAEDLSGTTRRQEDLLEDLLERVDELEERVRGVAGLGDLG